MKQPIANPIATTRPLFIAIEGIDGSGKSTLAHALYDFFTQHHYPVLLTKEPGGSSLGNIVRSLVNNTRIKRCPQAEFLLFAADRAQHFHEIIVPAYTNGTVIISDRCADSSLVYQGYAQGVELSQLQAINTWIMNDIYPTITLYLNISLETALKRLERRNDKRTPFENNQFLTKVINGFNELYKNRSDVYTINAEQPSSTVINESITALYEMGTLTKHTSVGAPLP